MSRAKIVQEQTKEKDILFLATYVELKNASLIFLSEREDRLGTLAAAVPQTEKRVGPPLSSVLLGDRNMMIARLLAERIAEKTSKIALASVFVKTVGEREAGPILLRLAEKTLKKLEERE